MNNGNNGNNGHANGANNGPNGVPKPYTLLNLRNNETIDTPNIPWLERFDAFCARVGAVYHWQHVGGDNGAPWTASLIVNGNQLIDVIGEGATQRQANADLVRQLQEATHALLHRPLLPEFAHAPPANNGPIVNNVPDDGTPPADGSSSEDTNTPNNGDTSA